MNKTVKYCLIGSSFAMYTVAVYYVAKVTAFLSCVQYVATH